MKRETEQEIAERIEWAVKDAMADEFLKSYVKALTDGYNKGREEGISGTLHIARQFENREDSIK